MIFKSEGVWIAEPGIVSFTVHDIAFLERAAPQTAKRRARLLAHEPEDKLHEMLIAFCSDSRNPPHAHEKTESMLVLKGMMTVHFPERNEVIVLNALDFLRIPPGIVHQPLPVTDCVVMETVEK